jgi:osmotically-inducible protein OsmY
MFPLLLAVALAASFAGCAATQTRESTGQFLDDSVVTAKVKAAIIAEPSLKLLEINIATYKGLVQLSGFVDTAAASRKAGEIAGTIEGVRGVRNDLIVK